MKLSNVEYHITEGSQKDESELGRKGDEELQSWPVQAVLWEREPETGEWRKEDIGRNAESLN